MTIFLIAKKYVFKTTRKDLQKNNSQPEESDLEAGEEVGAGQSELGLSEDAVHYLRFQLYIIAFLSLLTVLSIGVILPINFQGNNYGNKSDFGHSTAINLEAR